MEKWFELRVTGSAGTSAGISAGEREGIAVAQNGRLCSLASGAARRFDSKEQALEYLGRIRVSGDYEFEVVLCESSSRVISAGTESPISIAGR